MNNFKEKGREVANLLEKASLTLFSETKEFDSNVAAVVVVVVVGGGVVGVVEVVPAVIVVVAAVVAVHFDREKLF